MTPCLQKLPCTNKLIVLQVVPTRTLIAHEFTLLFQIGPGDQITWVQYFKIFQKAKGRIQFMFFLHYIYRTHPPSVPPSLRPSLLPSVPPSVPPSHPASLAPSLYALMLYSTVVYSICFHAVVYNACRYRPCGNINRGICLQRGTGYECKCKSGFDGLNCEGN